MKRLTQLGSRTEGRSAAPEVVGPGYPRLAQRGELSRLRDNGALGGAIRVRRDKPGVGVQDLEANGEGRAVLLRVGDLRWWPGTPDVLHHGCGGRISRGLGQGVRALPAPDGHFFPNLYK